MRNNLAEIADIDIDLDILYSEWCKQVVYAGDHEWQNRNYVELDFFTPYFQVLLESINDVIGEHPKNYVIQCHDRSLIDAKWYLNIVHADDDRKTCVTLPVSFNRMEPINFYSPDTIIPERGKPIKEKPVQVGLYSTKHPTLVNVANYHNVRVLDDNESRILIQLSYDLTFEEIISKQINTRII
jgi:hypothetical protein